MRLGLEDLCPPPEGWACRGGGEGHARRWRGAEAFLDRNLDKTRELTSSLEPLTCLLRVIIRALQGFARVCKSRIFKPVSLPWLARYCRMLRSRWCQSGVRSSWITRHQLLCARYASRDWDELPATGRRHARLLPPPALRWKRISSLMWSRGIRTPDLRRAKATR